MPEIPEEQRKALEEKIKNMSPEELKEFQKQQCIFCQIIAGKVPSKKIYGDQKCLAVLDINPAAVGHLLLLPKEHYSIMPQIPEKEISYLFTVAKYLSQVMLRKLKVEGTNLFVANGLAAGQKAQHFMIHIIPRRVGDNILEIPEHLVDKAAREKLGILIANKTNEIFGIKKEKIAVEEKKEAEEKKPAKKISSPLSKTKQKAKEEKAEEKKGEKEDSINLDDIAGLFK